MIKVEAEDYTQSLSESFNNILRSTSQFDGNCLDAIFQIGFFHSSRIRLEPHLVAKGESRMSRFDFGVI